MFHSESTRRAFLGEKENRTLFFSAPNNVFHHILIKYEPWKAAAIVKNSWLTLSLNTNNLFPPFSVYVIYFLMHVTKFKLYAPVAYLPLVSLILVQICHRYQRPR
jgi:hypothetical protein